MYKMHRNSVEPEYQRDHHLIPLLWLEFYRVVEYCGRASHWPVTSGSEGTGRGPTKGKRCPPRKNSCAKVDARQNRVVSLTSHSGMASVNTVSRTRSAPVKIPMASSTRSAPITGIAMRARFANAARRSSSARRDP